MSVECTGSISTKPTNDMCTNPPPPFKNLNLSDFSEACIWGFKNACVHSYFILIFHAVVENALAFLTVTVMIIMTSTEISRVNKSTVTPIPDRGNPWRGAS